MKILSTRARAKHELQPEAPMEFFAVAMTRKKLMSKTLFRSGNRAISQNISWQAVIDNCWYDSEHDAGWVKIRALKGAEGKPFMQPAWLEINADGIFHFKQGLWTPKKWRLTSMLVDQVQAYAPEPLFANKYATLVPDYDNDRIIPL